MKILVIGGSYFFGRWFVQFAHREHEVTVANRGHVPVGLPGVKELRFDREKEETCEVLGQDEYDCVVDFCAYHRGDMERIMKALRKSQQKQQTGAKGIRYFFISTVDVYRKGTGQLLTEDAPLGWYGEASSLPPEYAYMQGKIELEQELAQAASKYGIEPCSIRPAILYGPANYAPREKLYLDWISQAAQIIQPSDSRSVFQLMFVGDAARLLLALCEQQDVERAYNFCPEELTTYASFALALHEAVPVEFQEIRLTVSEILEKQIPLPFPLTEQESERYSGKRLAGIEGKRTTLAEGLAKVADTLSLS